MTFLELFIALLDAFEADKTIIHKQVVIEHRQFDSDTPNGVGVYPYKNKVGLSFYED